MGVSAVSSHSTRQVPPAAAFEQGAADTGFSDLLQQRVSRRQTSQAGNAATQSLLSAAGSTAVPIIAPSASNNASSQKTQSVSSDDTQKDVYGKTGSSASSDTSSASSSEKTGDAASDDNKVAVRPRRARGNSSGASNQDDSSASGDQVATITDPSAQVISAPVTVPLPPAPAKTVASEASSQASAASGQQAAQTAANGDTAATAQSGTSLPQGLKAVPANQQSAVALPQQQAQASTTQAAQAGQAQSAAGSVATATQNTAAASQPAVQASAAAQQQGSSLSQVAGNTQVTVKTGDQNVQTQTGASATGLAGLSPSAAVAAAAAQGEKKGGDTMHGEGQKLLSGSESTATAATGTGEAMFALAPLDTAAMAAPQAVTAMSEQTTAISALGGVGATALASAVKSGQAVASLASARQPALPNAVDQIKVQLGKGLAEGKDVISINLHPEEMGRVEVKLEMKEGRVQATVTADKPETLQALKSDSASLQQSLNDAGFDTDSNSLSFQLRGESGQGQTSTAKDNGESGSQRQRGSEVAADSQSAPAVSSAFVDDGLDISV